MTERQKIYEIKIKGHLDDRWADWFEGMTFTRASDGTTILSGPITDQAALHGILNGIRDLGLSLISVQRVDPDKNRRDPSHIKQCVKGEKMTTNQKTLKVEQLERYGKSISDLPKEAFKGQGKIMFRIFRKKFGLFGLLPFTFRVLKERRHLLKQYAKEYQNLQKLTPKGAAEITMMISLFNVIAQRESREKAYEFVKSIFQSVALRSMPALYQLDDLEKCEGDMFDNYKKFNIAMFKGSTQDFHVKAIEESENHLRIIVDKCLNVEAGKMFDCPEIAKLGCDHDLAGYPPIEDRVNATFRRPCTLAKGGTCCDFNFYRKGFEPKGTYVNK